MAHRHAPSWVIPETLRTLRLHYSILQCTEGVGNDILEPLADFIKRLEALEPKMQANPDGSFSLDGGGK